MQDAVTVLGGVAGTTGANLAIIVAALLIALISLAMTLPKVFNSMKTDSINGNVLTRVQALEAKAVMQDAKIHRYAVRTTKLTVLVVEMHGLLVQHKIDLTQEMIDKIVTLTKEMEEDDA